MTNSRMRAVAPLLALTIALGLGACGSETEEPGTDSPSESATQPPADDEETSSDDAKETLVPEEPIEEDKPTAGSSVELPTNEVPDDVIAKDEVQAAITDLAKAQSVEPEAVTVAGYFAVTWSDGSLGCPKPGMSYTMALVDGHLLVLEVDGEQFSYHAGAKPDFNFCADPKLPSDLGAGGASTS
ncbi:hypothetical protein [Ornithinimicrobium murale]|uniref:hypothetical protein n=1 Tax=Ornithinimicrobium murale TaxID=1050153 RepID=UPI0013B3706E|nr:hypothetical protein [Ornithinimicrobium murale]